MRNTAPNNNVSCSAVGVCYVNLAGDREVCYYSHPYGYDCYYALIPDLIANMTHCDLIKANVPPEIQPPSGLYSGDEDTIVALSTIDIDDQDAPDSENEPDQGFLLVTIELTDARGWFDRDAPGLAGADRTDAIAALDGTTPGCGEAKDPCRSFDRRFPAGEDALWAANLTEPHNKIQFQAYTDVVRKLMKAFVWRGTENMNSLRNPAPTIRVTVNDQGNTGGSAEETDETFTLDIRHTNDVPTVEFTPLVPVPTEDTVLTVAGVVVEDVDRFDPGAEVCPKTPNEVAPGPYTWNCFGTDGTAVHARITVTDGVSSTELPARGTLEFPNGPTSAPTLCGECGNPCAQNDGQPVGRACYSASRASWQFTATPVQMQAWIADLEFHPAQDFNGQVFIEVDVKDGIGVCGPTGPCLDVQETFEINFAATNDPPVITPVTITVDEDTQTAANAFAAITVVDVDTPTGLEFNIAVGNGTLDFSGLTPALTLLKTSETQNAASATTGARFASVSVTDINDILSQMNYQGNQDFFGIDMLELSVQDHDASPTVGVAFEQVPIEVEAVNDEPVLYYCSAATQALALCGETYLDVPGCAACVTTSPGQIGTNTISLNGEFALDGAGSNTDFSLIQVYDVDAADSDIQLLITAEHGHVHLGNLAAFADISFTIPNPGGATPYVNGEALAGVGSPGDLTQDTLLLVGPRAQINQALKALVYENGDDPHTGNDELVIAVNDLRHTGKGDSETAYVQLDIPYA